MSRNNAWINLMSRILVFEKNDFIRKALIQIIRIRFPDVAIRGIADDDEYAAEIWNFMPDILILGTNVYADGRMEILEQIRAKHPAVIIILLIDYDIEEYRKDAIRKGANHVISRELWTGGKILTLLHKILDPNTGMQTGGEQPASAKQTHKGRLDRRRCDSRGKAIEKEYLAHFHDRRN